MKLSLYKDLNDPYDFFEQSLDISELTNYKKYLSDKQGIICLSKEYHSPLMWGHYADNHKEICLGFDISDSKNDKNGFLWKIRYQNRPLLLSNKDKNFLKNKDCKNQKTMKIFKKIISTKSKLWSYEKEWRLFSNFEENSTHKNYSYFESFSEEFKLKEIILGVNCKCSIDDFESFLTHYNYPIEISRAKISKKI